MLFAPGEMRLEGLRSEIVYFKLLGPAQGELRRQPVPEAGVYLGAASKATSFDKAYRNGSEHRRHAFVAIEELHRLGRSLTIRLQAVSGALFEYHHIEAGFGKLDGGNGTAGTGANHQHFDFYRVLALFHIKHSPSRQNRNWSSTRPCRHLPLQQRFHRACSAPWDGRNKKVWRGFESAS